MNQPTPGQLAEFDQAYAEANVYLDQCIAAYRGSLATGENSREINLASLAQALGDITEPHALAQLLATALDRLERITPGAVS